MSEKKTAPKVELKELTVAMSRKGSAAIRALRVLQAQRDEIELKIKAHEETVKAEIGDVPIGEKVFATVGGQKVAYWRRGISRRINNTLLRKIVDADVLDGVTREHATQEFKLVVQK